MNKILRLSLIALLAVFCGGGVFAQVKLDFGDLYGATTISDISSTPKTVNGITVSFAKGNSQTAPAYNKSKEIRLYGGKSNTILDGNSMTVKSASGNMTNIVLTHGSSCTWGTITANVGNITVNADKDVTWVGNAEEVVFTISRNESAVATSTQYRITSATVTCGSSSKGLANLKFSEDKITIKQGDSFTAPTFTKSTTANVTFSSGNENVAKVNAEGVISLGTEIGTAVITATSEENDDYYAGTTTCTIEVYSAEPKTFKELQENVTKDSQPAVINFKNAIVTAVNAKGNNAYVVDEDGYGALIYADNHGFEAGDKITGKATGAFELYTGKTEITGITSASEGLTITKGNTVPVNEVAIDELSLKEQSSVVKISGLTLDETSTDTKIILTDGINKIQVYGSFMTLPAFESDMTYTVTGVVVWYNTTLEIAPRSEADIVGVPTAISNIKAEAINENAPIYNLAGQRVNKTAKGILIQNGKKFVNK